MPGPNDRVPLFPETARVTAAGHLEIGGCDAVALAREYGTPLYVFDEVHLRARAGEVREAFQSRWPRALPLYATKAYFSPFMARLCKEAGLGIDVTSEGELAIARRADFPPERIYLHGNNKTAAEIRTALGMGVEHMVLDHLDEIDLIASAARESGVTPRVLLRVAPAIDPHTHRYLATGVAESKFGLPLATGAALEAARRVAALTPHLQLVGLHVHLGSQIFELAPFLDALGVVLDFARELTDAVGFSLQEIDLGGGWGVPYTEDQQALPVDDVAQAVVSRLTAAFGPSRMPAPRLLVEPGRALVAQSAVALYTVGSVKEIADVRTYVSVDGGMGDNIRPALYGARYTAHAANHMNEIAAGRATLAGRYCEQGDILIDEVALPRVVPGDIIAVPVAGAYQIPMASNYNWIPRPAVVAARGGKARILRRRERIDDMLSCEADA